MNARAHLTQASELHDVICDLGDSLFRLRSLLRIADRLEDYGLENEEPLEDLCNVVHVSAAMAAAAKEMCDKADAQAGALALRMENKPKPGDRFPGEALAKMFEALIRRGDGCTAYGLSVLGTTLGAYAQHDASFNPAVGVWIGWMLSLGIKTQLYGGGENAGAVFRLGIIDAPGGADAVIGSGSK